MIQKRVKKVKLYHHQNKALRRVLNEPFYSLFMEQGTGKTPVAIKAIEERYKEGLITKVMICAPATILYNWELELHRFLELNKTEYTIERLNYKKKNKRIEAYKKFQINDITSLTIKQLKKKGLKGKTKADMLSQLEPKLIILLINYEKSRVMYKELRKFKPEFLIVDESHKLKNRNTQISKNIYKLTRSTNYRLMMTGTPICNGYEDLFMQFKIMDEDVLGSDYKSFESRYIRKGGYMGYDIVGYNNVSELKQIVKDNSFRIRIEDCIELPKLITRFLSCELNPKARKAYNEMNEDMLTQVDKMSDKITRKELKVICKVHGVVYSTRESYTSLFLKAAEFLNTASCELIITKVMRLQQICGGFLTLDSGDIIPISTDKLMVAKEAIMDAEGPVVIFCQYIPEIELLLKELPKIKKNKQSLRVRSYRNSKDRDQIYREFHAGKVDVLILQLRSGSVGLNLQISNKLIFYSWNFSSDDYVQAIARIKRHGQNRPMEIAHILAEDTIDIDILSAVQHKRELAEKLFLD